MLRGVLAFLFSLLIVVCHAQTYADVEPILLNKCGSCHNPGDAAPFPLLTYEDYAKRLSFIKEVVSSGYMPPFQADTQYRCFANQRVLTVKEKAAILAWIDNKGARGVASKGKANTASPNNNTWNGRKPDLVLKAAAPFMVKGDNTERFVEYKVPVELSEDKNIEAVEFVTNNKKVIHHINYGFYRVDDAAVDLHAGVHTINTDEDIENRRAFDVYKKKIVYYTGWIPGASIEYYPKDFGWILPRRGVVVFTTHYAAIAADEESVIAVNLYFKKTAIKREVRIISLGSGGIGEKDISPSLMIPPNKESSYQLKLKTPEEQSLLYVWPHMHFLGKSFEAFVITPQNDTVNLVKIPSWDFRWQELYRFQKPVKVPKGSMIYINAVYDNTSNNPYNPNKPPKYVFSKGSMKSDDEMLTLLLIYSPYAEGDELIEL